MPYSPATGLPIESQTISQMVDRILALPERTRLYLLAPIVRGRKGEYRKELAELQRKGFQRVRIDGEYYEIAETPGPSTRRSSTTSRSWSIGLVVRPDIATRLADSLETALGLAEGIAFVDFADAPAEDAERPERLVFSEKFACPVSGFTISEIEPRLFSFNNPFGACPKCDGLGTTLEFEAELVVPDPELTLRGGAVLPWAKTGSTSPYYAQTLEAICRHFDASMTTPWKDLPEAMRNLILFGSGKEQITFVYEDGLRRYQTKKTFEGVVRNIERRWHETDSAWVREELSRFQSDHPCEACGGHRLKPEALAVRIAGLHRYVAKMSIREAALWFTDPAREAHREAAETVRILKEIRERLGFPVDVGLDYLTLSRGSGTLSGGESQCIRLASQIGSGSSAFSTCSMALDRPAPARQRAPGWARCATRATSATPSSSSSTTRTILAADYVVDIGPGAGIHGGEIVASGTPAETMANPDSLTGQYLSGRLRRRRRPCAARPTARAA
ncbi:MAG: hypothetical protein R3D02_00390 [Hyphomicrobiales bacterium]